MSDFNQTPDEVIGLPAGFLQAGVAGVVGSLWPVNDRSTALLMIKFYELHLNANSLVGAQPVHPAVALRKAQLWLSQAINAELEGVDQAIRTKLGEAAGQTERHARIEEPVPGLAGLEPDARPYEHPYYWAAFVFYGA